MGRTQPTITMSRFRSAPSTIGLSLERAYVRLRLAWRVLAGQIGRQLLVQPAAWPCARGGAAWRSRRSCPGGATFRARPSTCARGSTSRAVRAAISRPPS
jgi:hypothetical protein